MGINNLINSGAGAASEQLNSLGGALGMGKFMKDTGSASTLDRYVGDAQEVLNKSAAEAEASIKESMKKIGDSIEMKFNLDFLNNLNLPNLPFMDELKALLGNLASHLKNSLTESIRALFTMQKDMLFAAADKALNSVLSRVYKSDIAFLADISVLYGLGGNLEYSKNYTRSISIKHNMPISLAWIDSKIGTVYGIDRKSHLYGDVLLAARNSAVSTIEYMLDKIKTEYDKDMAELIDYEESLGTKVERIKKALNDTNVPDSTKYYLTEDYNKLTEDEEYTSKYLAMHTVYLEYFNVYNDIMYTAIKNLIIYSYGNVEVNDISRLIRKYNIHPSAFGTENLIYKTRYTITSADVDLMAPFYSNHGTLTQTLQNQLGDTRLATTSNFQKYITLRNHNMKYIYLTLISQATHGDDVMWNENLYNRLSYPIKTDILDMMDDAASVLVEQGLGKDVVDALLAIEKSIYEYTKSVEDTLYNAANIEYFVTNDTNIYLPTDSDGSEGSSNSGGDPNDPSTALPVTPSNDDVLLETTLLTPTEKALVGVLECYFSILSDHQKKQLLLNFYRELLDIYNSCTDSTQKVYIYKYLSVYISVSINNQNFDIHQYINTVGKNTYSSRFMKLYLELFNESYSNTNINYNIYKVKFEDTLSSMTALIQLYYIIARVGLFTDTEVTSTLLYIFNYSKTIILSLVNGSDTDKLDLECVENFMRVFDEWFPIGDIEGDIYAPEYSIIDHLNDVKTKQREALQMILLHCNMNKENLMDYTESFLIMTFRKILTVAIPALSGMNDIYGSLNGSGNDGYGGTSGSGTTSDIDITSSYMQTLVDKYTGAIIKGLSYKLSKEESEHYIPFYQDLTMLPYFPSVYYPNKEVNRFVTKESAKDKRIYNLLNYMKYVAIIALDSMDPKNYGDDRYYYINAELSTKYPNITPELKEFLLDLNDDKFNTVVTELNSTINGYESPGLDIVALDFDPLKFVNTWVVPYDKESVIALDQEQYIKDSARRTDYIYFMYEKLYTIFEDKYSNVNYPVNFKSYIVKNCMKFL